MSSPVANSTLHKASPAVTALTLSLAVWLDVSRVLAAVLVYVGHSVALGVAPSFLSSTWHRSADDAVIAFFVISGFVIAHSTRARHTSAADYLLARASRIYSVAIPALLLALLVDLIGRHLDPARYAGYAWQYPQAWLVLGYHWLFLGEAWWGSTQPFSVEPYWSLTYEVWYYLLFGVLVFARGGLRWGLALLVVLLMGPNMLLLLPTWALGVWLQHVWERVRLGAWAARGLMLLALGAYAAFVASGLRDMLDRASRALYAQWGEWLGRPYAPGSTVHVLPDLLVALIFAVFLLGCAHARWPWRGGAVQAIRWLADRTFSFYLLHFSLLLLAGALGWRGLGPLTYLGFTLAVGLCAVLLAAAGEDRRQAYRRLFSVCLSALAACSRRWFRGPLPGRSGPPPSG